MQRQRCVAEPEHGCGALLWHFTGKLIKVDGACPSHILLLVVSLIFSASYFISFPLWRSLALRSGTALCSGALLRRSRRLALRFLPFPAVMLLLAALVLFVGPVWQFIKFEHRRVAGVTGIMGGPVGAKVACEYGK